MTTEQLTSTLAEQLEQFYGTECYHRFNMFFKTVATDGVIYFANKGGAFWALDEMCIMRMKLIEQRKIQSSEYLFYTITSKNGKADITCDDGNSNIYAKKHIAHTDLEEGTYKFYLMDNVLLLPSEY